MKVRYSKTKCLYLKKEKKDSASVNSIPPTHCTHFNNQPHTNYLFFIFVHYIHLLNLCTKAATIKTM